MRSNLCQSRPQARWGPAAAAALALLAVGLGANPAAAGLAFGPGFAGSYTFADLGPVPGVPEPYGGLTLKFDDPNTLLIGGNANQATGALYAIGVTRDAMGHITGFSGTSTRFADAAWNDGGVVYGPGNVLFLARWPQNELGQTRPGSSVTDKVINMAPFGVAISLAALNFVPAGHAGAGGMKLVSWSGGQWYEATIAPDGMGTYDVTSVTAVPASTLPGGPEGFVYVPFGSPGFATASMLVSDFSDGRISAYEVDGNGNPIVATRRLFADGLTGAEGAFIDPLTGDFLFSTFGTGGDRVFVVRGFTIPSGGVPEPGGLALAALGALGLLGYAVRRRRSRTA
jgi:hypothetical protein